MAVGISVILYPFLVHVSIADTDQNTCANPTARETNFRYLLVGASGASWLCLIVKIASKFLRSMSNTTLIVNFVAATIMSVNFFSECIMLYDCSTNTDVFGIVSPKTQFAEWTITVPLM